MFPLCKLCTFFIFIGTHLVSHKWWPNRSPECKSEKNKNKNTEILLNFSFKLSHWCLVRDTGGWLNSRHDKASLRKVYFTVMLRLALNSMKSWRLWIAWVLVLRAQEAGSEWITQNTLWIQLNTESMLTSPSLFFKCNRLSFLTSVLLFMLELLMSTESPKKRKPFF